MAFIPTPNAISLSFEFLLGGQVVVVTLSVMSQNPVTEARLGQAAQAGADWVVAELLPFLSSNLTFTGVRAYSQDSDSAPVFVLPVSPTIPGGQNFTTLPNNVAGVISLRTANRGRSGRGRMYIPGIPDTMQASPTTLTNVFVAGMVDAAIKLDDYFNPLGFQPGVISKRHNKQDRVTGLFQPFTSAVVDNRIDSQRRRLEGRGI